MIEFPTLLTIRSFPGSGIRGSYQRFPRSRKIPRELVQCHRSGTTGNPHHGLLLSQYGGGGVFGIPGLSPLARGPNLFPVSVDSIYLSPCLPDDPQSRAMQTHAGSLGVSRRSSSVALNKVLFHGSKVALLSLRLSLGQLSIPGQLFTLLGHLWSGYIYHQEATGSKDWEKIHELWQGLPSLRELFVRRYPILIDWLTAPNLIYLALDEAGSGWNVTAQSIWMRSGAVHYWKPSPSHKMTFPRI